ncbi:MAG TPA: PilW family protein, partial [Myxococcota bacterium]|nr:PilW family protein [Myxococcota bacterium]
GGGANGKVYTGVVKITGVSGTPPTAVTYDFDANPSNNPYPAFDCSSMLSGFAFGRSKIVEFHLDRGLTNPDSSSGATTIPRLMMLINRGGQDPATLAAPVEQAVAYDIEGFHVRYGLDCGHVASGSTCAAATSGGPDDVLDLVATGQNWCNDLTSANCNTGKSAIENQMRVMAVQVAVIPRTRGQVRRNARGATQFGSAIALWGSTLPADAYRHWIYRATVALRNNQLPITN